MNELVFEILAGLITAVLGFGFGFAYSKFRAFRRHRHLERLIPGDRRVQIVLPSAQVKSFLVKGDMTEAHFPSNVLVMPMPEGEAIATLVDCLRNLPRTVYVDLSTDDKVSNSYGLTISIGGPSVNTYSGKLLKSDFPLFQLNYPEHTACYGSTSFVPQRGKWNDLLEDYGFLFCCQESAQHRYIVLCGVWGTGTRAAVQGLIQLSPSSDMTQSLMAPSRNFIAFQTKIHGLEASSAQPIMNIVQE